MKTMRANHLGWFHSCLKSEAEEPMVRLLFRSLRRRTFCFGLLSTGVLLICQVASGQVRDWQPRRTWVFVVGALQWKHSDMFESFPQENRRDAQLVDFFRAQGVPASQLVYLKDTQATTRNVRSAFVSFLSKADEGDLLIVYYTGHGYKSDDGKTTYFATYDAGDEVSGWSTESIVRDINRLFKGSRAFLTADCCFSGSLSEQVRRAGQRVSYASLTSSSAGQPSTGNWTFTEMLLAGLSGRAFADLNGDGQITLGELAEDVKEDMSFAESQRSSFVVTGKFSADTVLAQAERRAAPEVSRRVEVKPNSDWYNGWYRARIIDGQNGKFKIHYFGWDDSDDEWVQPNQIRDPNVTGNERSANTRVKK
jgi:Caspase domain